MKTIQSGESYLPRELIIVPEAVTGRQVTVLAAAHTQPLRVPLHQPPLHGWRSRRELEVVEIPTRVVLWVFPVIVSLLESPPERDQAAEDDDDNDDDDDGDHGPGGLRWNVEFLREEAIFGVWRK